MSDTPSPPHRYSQFFLLFIFCTTAFIMAKSLDSGMADFQDNLYKKDWLIEQGNLFRITLKDRVYPNALIGKNGWMEYTSDGNIDDFQNVEGFKSKEDIAKKITSLNQYLNEQGISLVIVVAPNKASIYPDKLPDQIKPLSAQTRLDSLISYLGTNNPPLIVDLRPALRAARQGQDVYYKTNTHWNGYGAFTAYTKIINVLASSHPELQPYEAADFNLVTTDPGVQDISKLMNANFIKESSLYFTPKTTMVHTAQPEDYSGYNQFSQIPGSDLPTLLMFHDSFGATYLNDFLSLNFKKSHFIHLMSVSRYLNKESIQYFDPDIIIIEIVERDLEQLNRYLPDILLE